MTVAIAEVRSPSATPRAECRFPQLAVRVDGWTATGDSTVVSVAITNAGSKSCSVGPRYAVSLLDAAGIHLADPVRLRATESSHGLDPTEAVTGVVDWRSWCGDRSAPAALALAVPGAGDIEWVITDLPATLDVPRCAADGASSIKPFVVLPEYMGYDTLRKDAFLFFEEVSLNDDGRKLVLTFIGAPPFREGDPCTGKYAASVLAAGEELHVGVFGATEPGGEPTGSCTDVGYVRELEITLSAPFRGSKVRDLAGFLRFVRPPDRQAKLTELPKRWQVRAQYDVATSPTGQWVRVYSPVAGSPTTERNRLTFIQVFDAPADPDTVGEPVAVTVNGKRTTLYRYAEVGRLTLTWRLGDHGLILVANEADFSVELLIKLAESAVLPEG